MFFFNPSTLLFLVSQDLYKQYINIRCKWLIISKFCLLSANPEQVLCCVFCGRTISEFNTSWNLDQRDFVLIQRDDEIILSSKSIYWNFTLKYT